jgi:hypothetical protein
MIVLQENGRNSIAAGGKRRKRQLDESRWPVEGEGLLTISTRDVPVPYQGTGSHDHPGPQGEEIKIKGTERMIPIRCVFSEFPVFACESSFSMLKSRVFLVWRVTDLSKPCPRPHRGIYP